MADRNRKATGYFGEDVARRILESRGYRLVEKNYTTRRGEIDLIMRKNNEIIFVEVKTRKNQAYGSALESSTPQKKDRIIRAAKVFLCSCRDVDPDVRFFAVEVLLDETGRHGKVRIYEDIFI